MCVLICKPKGVKIPNLRVLDACRVANPHGCGFATPTKFYKGLNYVDFLTRLNEVQDDEPCIIHFRYATNGTICEDNCHPFYNNDTNTYFAHNGVLSLPADYENYEYLYNMTDSEYAFIKMFVPAIASKGLNSVMLRNKVSSVIGYSKFAFLKGDRLKMFGDFKKLEGCYFSNFRFMTIY